MPKQKQKRTRKPAAQQSKAYRAGIVVVHGVGNQRPGATIEHVTRRIGATLRELGLHAESADVPATLRELEGAQPEATGSAAGDGEPRAKGIEMGGARPVLVAEAHWSDIVRDHREKGWRPAVSRIWFVVAVLPYLFSAVLAPRTHEMKKSASEASAQHSSKRSTLDHEINEMVVQAPTMWRGITAMALVLAVALAFAAWEPWIVGLAIAGSVALLLLLTRSSFDVIEHVRMAGLGRAELELVLARVGATVDHVAGVCDEVWVIGYSQGGYIAHRLLAENRTSRWPAVVRFTGVASGLRPIRLIEAVRSRSWILAGWVWMGALASLTAGILLLFEPGGPLNSEGSRLWVHTAVLFFAQAPMMIAEPMRIAPLWQIVSAGGSSLMPTQWWWLACLLLALVCIIIAVLLQRRGGATLPDIPALPKRIRWEEVTSPSDLVGSMSVPDIPETVTERTMPSMRQPVLDHLLTSYLGARSMLRFEIAEWLMRAALGSRRIRGLHDCTKDLTDLAERTYRLRMTVQLLFLVFAVVLPAMLGASLLTAASTVLYAGMALAVITALLAGIWWFVASSKRVGRFVRDATTELALPSTSATRRRGRSKFGPRITIVAAFVGFLGGWGCFLLAAVQQSSGRAELRPLIAALQSAGITLFGVALLALVAFCLAVVRLRGVRAVLALSVIVLMNELGLLRQVGPVWQEQYWPGVTPLVVTGIVVVAALLWSRPRVEGGQSRAAAGA